MVCGNQHSFCFLCDGEDHRPTSCKDIQKWLEKNSSESANANWLLVNTKPCPACRVHIEKNQGCNHMTCRSCRHEFCWLCFHEWSSHTSCANYTEGSTKKNLKYEQAKSELDRYMHFWTRYDNHDRSVKFAEKSYILTQERLDYLNQAKNVSPQQTQYLLDAVKSVIECKRILKFTYVYAYYSELPATSNLRKLFQSHQERLEEFADHLQGLYERKTINDVTDSQYRREVISYTRLVEKYRNNVVNSIMQSNDFR